MCVLVRIVGVHLDGPVWDRPSVAILLAPGLTHGQALRQARALLIRLGAEQADHCGATCWCGDPVTVPGGAPAVPRPRTPLKEGAHGVA